MDEKTFSLRMRRWSRAQAEAIPSGGAGTGGAVHGCEIGNRPEHAEKHRSVGATGYLLFPWATQDRTGRTCLQTIHLPGLRAATQSTYPPPQCKPEPSFGHSSNMARIKVQCATHFTRLDSTSPLIALFPLAERGESLQTWKSFFCK